MTPEDAALCERLKGKARASFEVNKSFGRKGKEWAIEAESDWQAAAALERLSAENEALRDRVALWEPSTMTSSASSSCGLSKARGDE